MWGGTNLARRYLPTPVATGQLLAAATALEALR
jgi:hypothetical protein